MDIAAERPWSHTQNYSRSVSFSRSKWIYQGKTRWWTNNTAPTAAAATNTAAIAGATTLIGLVSVLPTYCK